MSSFLEKEHLYISSKLIRRSSRHKKNLSFDRFIYQTRYCSEQIPQWSKRGESNPHHSLGKAVFEPLNYVCNLWRSLPDLNRWSRFCRPTPYHLAKAPSLDIIITKQILKFNRFYIYLQLLCILYVNLLKLSLIITNNTLFSCHFHNHHNYL